MNNMKTIFLCLVILMLLVGGVSDAGTYLDSAHGNSTYGVDRTSTTQYTIGHCAHCHEQHASIAGTEPDPKTGDAAGPDQFCLLANNLTTAISGPYLQDDNACFYCHYDGIGTLQATPFSNYSYSKTFGGNSDTTPATIFDAFNLTSYHNLKDVYSYITGAKGTKTWTSFPAGSNPCSGCHNVHIAQKSCGKPGGTYDPTKSAISKPSDHGNLWGDDDTERMDDYPNTYQSPYWYDVSPTYFEPYSNNTTQDGSNLPNYAAFCLDCHVNAVPKLGVSAAINAINWGGTGDQHGQAAAAPTSSDGSLKAPYADASSGIYALSCTDCHEPHGSSNEWLFRTEVNAKKGISITTPGVWYEFCTACHIVNLTSDSHSSLTSSSNCSGSSCHEHGDKF
jgi:hypothetical protein